MHHFDFIVEDSKAVISASGDLDEHDIGAAVRLRTIDADLIRSTHPLLEEAGSAARTPGNHQA